MPINSQVTDHIRALEESLLTPEVRRSSDRLRELLSQDFIEFSASGRVYTRDDILRDLPQGREVEITMERFELRALAADVVLATYRACKRSPGKAGGRYSLRSSIWVRYDGHWRMVFHQGTPEYT
jgi:hypothetical protein